MDRSRDLEDKPPQDIDEGRQTVDHRPDAKIAFFFKQSLLPASPPLTPLMPGKCNRTPKAGVSEGNRNIALTFF